MLTHSSSPARPARVVVIGATGFVGAALVARLRRDDIPVLALGSRDLDLLAPDAADRLAALLSPTDSVVAAAAIAPVKNASMLKDNITLAQALTAALAKVPPAHVVNVSSDAVYGDLPVPLTEDNPAAPGSLHGVMHLARELMFRAEVKAPLAMVRPSLLYGAKDPHNGYGPNQFRRKANAGTPISLFGEGEERRDHVYIDDVAEVIARILLHRSTGVLNIATGVVHSFKEIAETAIRLAPRAVEIVSLPRSGPMPHNGYRPFDPAACHAAFPDFRYTPLEEGMAAAQRQEFA